MSHGHQGHNLLEGIFCCRDRGSDCKSTIREYTDNIDLLGKYRAEDGQA